MIKVIIVGGGVVGCAVARELSRYDCQLSVLERSFDVSEGTSKANSGIVHAGFDAKPNTLKAKYNVLGNKMFDRLAKELEFSFCRNGRIKKPETACGGISGICKERFSVLLSFIVKLIENTL